MEGMGTEWRGCVHRIMRCALELASMEDDVGIDGDGDDEDAAAAEWELVGSSLRLKSTFLYCDLSRLLSIAAARDGDCERKKLLAVLSDEVFWHLDQLGNAVESRNISETKSRFKDAAHALKELMAVLEASL